MTDCGCRIRWHKIDNFAEGIDYCPLHAAAGQMQEALRDVLDGLGALNGRWWELTGYGFSEERAKEIIALAVATKEAK